MRSALEKTARTMLQFQETRVVVWRRRSPAPGPGTTGEPVLIAFAESLRGEYLALRLTLYS